MTVQLTVTQRQRLVELNTLRELLDRDFETNALRDHIFKQTESELSKENREKLLKLMNEEHRPLTFDIESRIVQWLTGELREGSHR